ncbi:single-stranded DNA-binding protein [Pseudonocardia sp. Cha107L01]|uniref:single-stranded DNA-binding protein n=1 Tax=Pseudonocardia sp. Cha107L01 TaxID=3457576 RepID=UPI00403EA983
MSGDPMLTLIGNLTDDPETRYLSSGAAVAVFTVASTPRLFDRESGEWRDGETLFQSCQVWRDHAENVVQSLTKGTRVIVHGRLRQRSFETDEGERRRVTELDVDEVGPALRFATVSVHRISRERTSAQPESAGAPSDQAIQPGKSSDRNGKAGNRAGSARRVPAGRK